MTIINLIITISINCLTQIRTNTESTEVIEIKVGLHQGSALSPLLFIIIVDVITESIEEDTP